MLIYDMDTLIKKPQLFFLDFAFLNLSNKHTKAAPLGFTQIQYGVIAYCNGRVV